MPDLNNDKKNILEFIKLKFDNYGSSSNIGIFGEDIEYFGIGENILYNILLNLEKNNFIKNLKVTDPDGGVEIDGRWVPWFAADECYFPGFYTFCIPEDFNTLYKKYYKSFGGTGENVFISKGDLKFDDDKAIISLGNLKCQLPPYKNEHFFCRAIFQYPVDEFIDWSSVFGKMDENYNLGKKEEDFIESDKRLMQDTVIRLNNRAKNVFGINVNLFTWKIKSIKRNY